MPFTSKDFTTILEESKADLLSEIPQAKITNTSWWTKILRVFSYRLSTLWSALESVYTASKISDAIGSDLDDLAFNFGLTRKLGLQAEVYVKFEGNAGTSIPSAAIVQTDPDVDDDVKSFQIDTASTQAFIEADTIAFNDDDPDTITDSNNGFLTAGFASGDLIIVEGSTDNDGIYTIDTVDAGTITLVSTDELSDEIAGEEVKITKLILFNSTTGGEDQNVGANTLTILQTPISGITSVTNPSPAINGTDDEEDGKLYRPDKLTSELLEGETNSIDTTTLRGRLIDRIQNNLGKTTKTGYEQTALSVSGVLTANATNSSSNPPVISLFITSNIGNGIPDADLINAVQEEMDKDENKSPLDVITVIAPTSETITIEYEITDYASGYDFATVRNSVKSNLISFVNSLGTGQDVLIEALDNVVYNTAGVADFERDLPLSNVTVASTKKAVTSTSDITIT